MAHLVTNAIPAPGTNPPAPLALREVKPPVPIPWNRSWLFLLALPIAGLLLLAALYFILRRSRLRPQPPALIVIPPHVRARHSLRHALDLLHQPKPFCTALSHTLRLYLEERFNFHAPDRTTDEFLEELQASPHLALRQKQSLADFLTRCDLVKFAREEPPETDLRALFDAAERLISETAPDTLAGPNNAPPAPSTTA